MSNPPKVRLVQKIIPLLKKRYEVPGRREPLPVLEQMILALLADGTTTARADAAFQRLKAHYFDWNEVRVSAVAELQEVLADLPEPEQKATRIKGCLKHVFETTYSFDINHFRKLPQKEVAKKMSRMPGSSEYLVSRVIRDGLGGNAVPLDSAAVRVFTRLGLIDEKTTPEVLGASLARMVPRARGFEYCHLISELAADTCIEGEPRCLACVLVEVCPTGQRRSADAKAAAARRTAKRDRTRSKTTRSKAK